jgi:hypothetical protein
VGVARLLLEVPPNPSVAVVSVDEDQVDVAELRAPSLEFW